MKRKTRKHAKCKTTIQNLKSFLILLPFIFYLLSLLSGCAAVIEGAKGFVGISTRSLEEARKDAITKTFNYDYFTCYTKTLEILKQIGAYIYAKDIKRNIIAIYVSEQNTTPVGLFFKLIDQTNTQIEVSSLSSYAKEFIAAELFAALEQPVNIENE